MLIVAGTVLPKRLSAAELEPSLIHLLQRLVQTPSVNGVDTEIQVTKILEEYASSQGCETALYEAVADRPVLTISSSPTKVPGLLIIAHTDTVPVGPESDW